MRKVIIFSKTKSVQCSAETPKIFFSGFPFYTVFLFEPVISDELISESLIALSGFHGLWP